MPPHRPQQARSGGRSAITPTTAERLDRLRDLHLAGVSTAELRRHCRDQWNLSDRQASRLLVALRQRIAADWQAVRPTLLPELLARAEHVYKLALEHENLPVAIASIRTIARLAGLDGPITGEHVARLLEAIATAPLDPEARLTVQLALVAKGVLPLEVAELEPCGLEAIAALPCD